MKPTKDIEASIKNVNIVINTEVNKNRYGHILQAFKKSKAKKSKDEAQIKAADKLYYDATVLATDVPLKVMTKIIELTPYIKRTAEFGNVHAISDAGVGALMIVAGVKGAGLNVKINLSGFEDTDEYKIKTLGVMNNILAEVDGKAEEILAIVEAKM